jgi:hypothetical protein
MKMRMLHQFAADHVKGLLRGPVAYAVAVTGESPLEDFCMASVGERMEDKAYRFFIRSARRPSYTCDAYPKACFAVSANAFRKRSGNLAANGAMFGDQERGHAGQSRFYGILVNHSTAQKVS